MSDLGLQRVGPVATGTGTAAPFRADITGAQVITDAHGRYAEAVRRGNVYFLNLNGTATTAYVGAGGGVPAVSVMNPAGSGKNMELLGAAIGIRTATNATASITFNLWAGVSVSPTGTPVTLPTNALTIIGSGSVGRAFNNTAATGSTALSQIMPLATYYWASGVGANLATSFIDLAGLAICVPGNMIAIGSTIAVTADVSVFWEEVPILT